MTEDPRSAHWEAEQNRQPPAPFSTRVCGMPLMPTPGHTPLLTRAEPQGVNPRVLLLDLHAIAPVRPTTQVVTPVHATYDERSALVYDQVQIRSGVGTEPDATVEVQVLQVKAQEDMSAGREP